MLRAKLARLHDWNKARCAAAARYDELLQPLDVVRPMVLDGNVHAWHLYVIRIPGARRDRVLGRLTEAGVGAAVHYPVPIHRTPAFRAVARIAGTLRHAEAACTDVLSLPLYPHITADQQEFVVAALGAALSLS